MESTIKCRKCRNILLDTNATKLLLDPHGNLRTETDYRQVICPSVLENETFFLAEENLPEWILKEIEISQWTKGKLKCLKCEARVGSFDFVSGNRCNCAEGVLPPVHIVRSKVDHPNSMGRLQNS